MVDEDFVLELWCDFGYGMIILFVRIEGWFIGIVVNNFGYLVGVIDSDVVDKVVCFM